MNLYDSIFQRKSCRNYDGQPFSEERLAQIREAIAGFDHLYPDVALDYRFTTETKGFAHIKAPNYLIVSGQRKPGEMEQAGFLFQQLILWFDAHNIGSVWLGATKDAEGPTTNDLITIAFGDMSKSVHRDLDGFKRKAIDEITNAPDDSCIQAAHLAPSGVNLQPWYFDKADDKVLLYKQTLKLRIALVYKKADIDLGIALCHYALACKQLGKPFTFERKEGEPVKEGFSLFGQIS